MGTVDDLGENSLTTLADNGMTPTLGPGVTCTLFGDETKCVRRYIKFVLGSVMHLVLWRFCSGTLLDFLFFPPCLLLELEGPMHMGPSSSRITPYAYTQHP